MLASSAHTNVGTPHEITLRQLSSLVHSILGGNPRITHQARLVDDPVQRQPDISRIQQDLALSLTTSTEQDLRLNISHLRHAL